MAVFNEAERRLVLEVLESGRWWYGEKVRQFEAEFAAFQGARFGVTATNGTTAIEAGLRALGIVEGDEVIVPPYSFMATASSVVTSERFLSSRTSSQIRFVSIPPRSSARSRHAPGPLFQCMIAGYVADMDRLTALAQKHNLRLLEDAAHSWGSQWKGRGTGALGDCGTFSFQVSKNITASEGGILLTDDEALADLCRSFTNCGRRKGSAWYDHEYLGSNLRLTEFQAAVLLAQLGRLEEQTMRRQANARILDDALKNVPGIRLLAFDSRMTRRSYHIYLFRLDEATLGLSRDRFLEALNAEGIPVSKGWYRPLYANGVFQNAHRGPAHGIISPARRQRRRLHQGAMPGLRAGLPGCGVDSPPGAFGRRGPDSSGGGGGRQSRSLRVGFAVTCAFRSCLATNSGGT